MPDPLPHELAEALHYAEILARRMVRHPTDQADAEQVGRIGTFVAWQRYDRSRGIEFGTIAHHYARGWILHWLRDRSWAGRKVERLRAKAQAVWKEQRRKSFPGLEEPPDVDLPVHLRAPLLLDDRTPEANEHGVRDRYVDLLAADTGPEPGFWLAVRQILDPEDPRLAYILRRRFVDGLSQDEVAPEIQRSQFQVSRLERRALALLRAVLTELV